MRNLAGGEYEIIVRYIGYKEVQKKITLNENEVLLLDFKLVEENLNLTNVDVFGTLNKEEETASRLSEKNADNIINVISARAMEKSPDINAANVLQRMSGITIQRTNGGEGGYAIIRGMEPRYNNTLVNGIKIASPDDKNRFVPLDIVPSDLLKRIEVTKSLLPNMEGDAIGGTVNMVMKDAPDTLVLKLTSSVGYSQIFLDKKYDSFDRSVISHKSPNENHSPDYEVQPGDFSRNNLKLNPVQASPNFTAGITYGRRFYRSKLGFIISGNAQSQYRGIESEFNTVSPDSINVIRKSNTATRVYSSHQTNYGLVTHVDYRFNQNNRLGIHNVLLYSDYAEYRFSVDTTLQGDSRTVPGTGLVNYNTRTFTNHQLVENLKLEGSHNFSPSLALDWAGVYSQASKKAPDRAELPVQFRLQNDPAHTPTPFYISLPGISRIWQHNDDKDYTALFNLTRHQLLVGNVIEVKIGGLYRAKSRFNLQNRYILRPLQDSVTKAKVIYTGIDSADWTIYNPAGTYDEDVNNYTANEKVAAGYFQRKIEISKLQILAGIRFENTHQYFKTKAITTVTGQITAADINYFDALPGIHFKYRLTSKQNLRISYFKSISRPNYYELVPSIQRGSEFNSVGNPRLKHAVADNVDVRYEWYPDPESQWQAGVFYKKILNLIEYGLVGH